MKRFLGLVFIVFLVGCGYKPTSYYAKEAFGEGIYAQVSISRSDPKNSVVIKDAINEAIITRFGSKLTTKEKADTKIKVSFGSIGFSAILYDANGYVIAYKAKISLNINYTNKNGNNGVISSVGEYDFPIEANSVISDTKRFEAIRYASLDAINEFVSKVAVKGMKDGEHSK